MQDYILLHQHIIIIFLVCKKSNYYTSILRSPNQGATTSNISKLLLFINDFANITLFYFPFLDRPIQKILTQVS